MGMSECTLIAAYRSRWRTPEWRHRRALTSADMELDYGELADRVEQLAAGLVDAGVQAGDTVALSMARTGDSVVVLLAILFAGACVCPLEPRLSAAEVARRLARVRCRWALADDSLSAQFEAVEAPCQVLDRAALRPDEPSRLPAIGADGPALLLFTSGSTGQPKAVLLRHRAVHNNAHGLIAHTGLTAQDCLLHIMPIYHTNGVNNQIFAPFLAGATVAFAPRFRAADMPALMARYRPTLVSGVPTMYSRMLEHDFDPDSLARLRMLRCGSAPITPDLHRRLEARFGCPVVVSYGLSEATCTSTMNPPGQRRIGSVGTVLADQTVTLLDSERDTPVAPGRQGEIAIRGANLMAGYLDDAGVPDPELLAGGWLRTGDLGRFDDDGYLFITGRIKDVIIRGGENIPPGAIEDVLSAHPQVAACCVVGRPDADLGEVPVAFVVAMRGTKPASAALMERVEIELSRSWRPAEIRFVASLPENAVGKIDRKALAHQVAIGGADRAASV